MNNPFNASVEFNKKYTGTWIRLRGDRTPYYVTQVDEQQIGEPFKVHLSEGPYKKSTVVDGDSLVIDPTIPKSRLIWNRKGRLMQFYRGTERQFRRGLCSQTAEALDPVYNFVNLTWEQTKPAFKGTSDEWHIKKSSPLSFSLEDMTWVDCLYNIHDTVSFEHAVHAIESTNEPQWRLNKDFFISLPLQEGKGDFWIWRHCIPYGEVKYHKYLSEVTPFNKMFEQELVDFFKRSSMKAKVKDA